MKHKWIINSSCQKNQFATKTWRCKCGATKLFKGIGQAPIYWDKTGALWYTKVPPCSIA